MNKDQRAVAVIAWCMIPLAPPSATVLALFAFAISMWAWQRPRLTAQRSS